MDLESYVRWDDYSKARDEMLSKTHTKLAPWYVVDSNDKRRARLNIIHHLLSQVSYNDLPLEKIKLKKRNIGNIYHEINPKCSQVPEIY